LRTSLPLATGAILAMLTINYPPLALGVFRSAADVGLYGAASKMVFFLLLGDRILATLLLPASARIHARSPQETASALTTTLRWVVVLGLPIAVGGTLLAAPLVTIVFGQSYLPSVQILQVFIWYFFVTMIHTVYTSGLIAVGSERTYGWIMTGTAVLYVSLITTGAIWWGPVGAAMGVVVSELLR
ncbi:MAG: oligosaccharide flippase family protein, partial [Bacteroidetes bacterium]|nr:oligosaccharide flippase family protein [Bacteroidota bacterium]